MAIVFLFFWVDLIKIGDIYFINEYVDCIVISYDGLIEGLVWFYVGELFFIYLFILFIYNDLVGLFFILFISGIRDLLLSDMVWL